MPTDITGRRRAALAIPLALTIVLSTGGPAGAHVEVTAQGAQAGTGPATIQFSAESESSTSGIVGMRTQLPGGIDPTSVSLATGPAGWVLTPTADGFEVAGPALGPGVDAEYAITVAELPADSTELVFPTLQRYADGREDAWIEPVIEGSPDPEMPAPTLTVAAAPVPAAPTTPTGSAPSSRSGPTSSAPTESAADPAADESNTGTIALTAAGLLVVALGAGVWWWRSRRTG
ncbi:DUF1775 domain-containing protein [Blastococcus sp. TF02-9]|uniref:DUF1775 domain-containing protein n=1 Tax=Blastococcus sp. TF02-09 TaxID=2250576 RepID=UPI001314FABF|nr:DUF1775 domain-containing protein [Blastococcus sp. TF02-9]